MSRYNRLKTIQGLLGTEGCPVVLEKGALLSDAQEQKNLLQLQFRNIQEKEIAALYLMVAEEDLLGQSMLAQTDFKYLDLQAGVNQCFGSKQPVYLKNNDSRSFDFIISQVVFSDRTVWKSDKMLELLQKPEELTTLGRLHEQYLRDFRSNNSKSACLNLPTDFGSYWYCACGTLNDGKNRVCINCKADKALQFKLKDPAALEEHLSAYEQKQKELEEKQKELEEKERLEREAREAEKRRIQEKQKIERDQRIERERKEKAVKKKRRIVISSLIAVIAIIGIVFLVNYRIQYQKEHPTLAKVEVSEWEETEYQRYGDMVYRCMMTTESDSTPYLILTEKNYIVPIVNGQGFWYFSGEELPDLKPVAFVPLTSTKSSDFVIDIQGVNTYSDTDEKYVAANIIAPDDIKECALLCMVYNGEEAVGEGFAYIIDGETCSTKVRFYAHDVQPQDISLEVVGMREFSKDEKCTFKDEGLKTSYQSEGVYIGTLPIDKANIQYGLYLVKFNLYDDTILLTSDYTDNTVCEGKGELLIVASNNGDDNEINYERINPRVETDMIGYISFYAIEQ